MSEPTELRYKIDGRTLLSQAVNFLNNLSKEPFDHFRQIYSTHEEYQKDPLHSSLTLDDILATPLAASWFLELGINTNAHSLDPQDNSIRVTYRPELVDSRGNSLSKEALASLRIAELSCDNTPQNLKMLTSAFSNSFDMPLENVTLISLGLTQKILFTIQPLKQKPHYNIWLTFQELEDKITKEGGTAHPNDIYFDIDKFPKDHNSKKGYKFYKSGKNNRPQWRFFNGNNRYQFLNGQTQEVIAAYNFPSFSKIFGSPDSPQEHTAQLPHR